MRTATLLLAYACAAAAQDGISGNWVAFRYESDRPIVVGRLILKLDGDKLTGTAAGQPVEGTYKNGQLEFSAARNAVKAKLEGGMIVGEATPASGPAVRFKAERLPPKPAQPRTHDFEPTQFHLYFTSTLPPVMRIHPGDRVRTWSVDAGGTDKAGKRRSAGGNPQTGPFFIEGTLPGDTLVVRLERVRTNRDWAGSGNQVMRNALEPWSLADLKWTQGFNSRWKLDAAAGTATLEKPTDKLKNFTVPLKPMLGCVATAPPGESSVRTTDSGRFGGNMDYNQLTEGTTLYLPVYHLGALLFLGDGHAAQGDGELTGDALETSMDFEFSVDVIPGKSFGHPLSENSEYLTSIGIGGSLDQALQMATSGLMRWLDRDYGLSATEAAIVLGFAVKYDVADLVGTQVSIAAKLPKSALAKLEKTAK